MGFFKPGPALDGEEADRRRERVLGQGCVDTVFEHRAQAGDSHAGAWQLALVPDLPGWKPDCGEGAVMEKDAQAVCVELVGLVDISHHDFGLCGVSHERNTPGGKTENTYWFSGDTFIDGFAVFTWEGEDEGGNTITIEERVHLLP